MLNSDGVNMDSTGVMMDIGKKMWGLFWTPFKKASIISIFSGKLQNNVNNTVQVSKFESGQVEI